MCQTHQWVPSRWLKFHNLQILKKPGVYKINKLRTIHKIESEMNLMRREINAKRLMQNAEQHQALDEDQHGGRNGRCAMDIVMGKTYMLETFHLQRSNAGFTNCDAKGCYNRIVPLILLLAYYKKGLPYKTCVFLSQILYNMEHTITTAYGPGSQANYNGLFASVFGIGQGLTDGPSGWTCISDSILKTYHRRCSGCSLQDPLDSINI